MSGLNDGLEKIDNTGKDILAAIRDVDSSLDLVNGWLQDVISAIQDSGGPGGSGPAGGGRATGAAAGGRGGAGANPVPSKTAAGSGGGGGSANFNVMAMARAHPVVAAMAAIGGVVGPHLGAGVVSAAQGGSFSAGFETSANRALGKIPIFGEATQMAGAARIQDKTTARVAQAVGQIEALGGRVSPEDEQFLLNEVGGQELRREDAEMRLKNQADIFYKNHPEMRGNRTHLESGALTGNGLFGPFGVGVNAVRDWLGQHR